MATLPEKSPVKSESSVDEEKGNISEETFVPDPKIEKRIIRKFDIHILPLLAIMYLCNSIDKSNLGNAKTDTLEADLKLTGNDYNMILSIFYIPFVLSGTPMNLLTKRYGANKVLPIAMIIFGGMAMIGAATKNFGGMLATRWFLGMAESGFLPGVIFYLTTFYKRTELAGRLSVYYGASQIAGAFTGLLAYGFFQIDGSLSGWKILFLFEGGATVLVGIISLLVLPKSAATAYFLNDEEKKVAYFRIASDSSSTVDAQFSFRQAVLVFKKEKIWPVWMAIGFCLGVPLFSVSNFLPQIVAGLGYNHVKTNLYTVAPNVVGTVFLICTAFSSDYFRNRCYHLALCLSLSFLGFFVLIFIDPSKQIAGAYVCCFIMSCGSFISSPLLSTWYNNNCVDENRRAILTPVLVASANAMGAVSSNIFRNQDAPRYLMACIINSCFAITGVVLTLATGFWMKYDNARRNKEQGVVLKPQDVPTSELGENPVSHPGWRWVI